MDKVEQLLSRARSLAAKFKQGEGESYIEEAIILDREALEHCQPGHPERSVSLIWLSIHLSYRYGQLGTMQDLNEAIDLDREALELCPQGHSSRSQSLNNLAVHLAIRYKQLGAMQDLNQAIVLDRAVLELRPQGHPQRLSPLINLAADLSTRYEQLGPIQDLNEAIALVREAADLCPPGHPDRPMSLNNLAVNLSIRHDKLGGMEDLNEATTLAREALDLCPQGHPYRADTLSNLSIRLSTRYNKLGAMEDLDEAIVLSREAVDVFPRGHPYRALSLNNLAGQLFVRHNKVGAIQDLNEAIVIGREALDLFPQGHPERSGALNNLVGYLFNRFKLSGRLEDREESFTLYHQLVDATQVTSSTDLDAARGWIRMAEEYQHPTLSLAYETSLRLLVQHLAALPSLPQHLSVLKNLTSSLAVDAFSACLRNRSPTKAVELLEQGRGVFWSQLTRLRSPLEDVIASGPAGEILADEFSRLASLIRKAVNSAGPDQHENVFRLNIEMQGVVTKIRKLPGHSRFLLPSLFLDLQRAAEGGPVIVVSASKYGCDALVILLDRDPVHIHLLVSQRDVRDLSKELHTLTIHAKRADVAKQFASFLRKLWDQIVRPIADFLLTALPAQSRIWWCPTAEFSALPLHAAGPFRKGQQNLPDLYTSSYTPTLTALIRARQSELSDSTTQQKHFIAIGEGKAAGQNELPSVGVELDVVGQRIGGLATFTRIEGEESCIDRVVEEIRKNEWVHFSCHGLPDRIHPFESAFALYDGRFTIQHIIGCELKNPEFAYLSACHTTVGYQESPDEVIHLASAMQFAGFRSVIGTMWAVDDGQTSKITSTFYKRMVDESSGRLDHTRAAYALNKTMKSINIPFDQKILYIHIGV